MTDFPIQSFDPKTASDSDYAVWNAFQNRMRAEVMPDDPPIPLAEAMAMGRNIPGFVTVSMWGTVLPDESAIVAVAQATLLNMEENQHLAEFGIQVLPEYRRQGLARKLLARIVEVVRRENRRLMITNTNERVPGGAAFVERIGARAGMASHTNQLKIADLNRELVRTWLARASERAANFELGFWDAAYPEADLPAIADLYLVMNTAPRDNLEVEDMRFTPEHLRQMEQGMFARGTQRWTLFAREKATGKFAGFTDAMWNANRPEILSQGNTGVFPEFRNHGLGRWLKAAMLEKVLRQRPPVKFVRTGNADSNAAMLKINNELGFKPYISQTTWQVETERVEKYLGNPSVQ